MDVRLNNPDIQAKIDRWVAETGRGPDELIEDAIAGYIRHCCTDLGVQKVVFFVVEPVEAAGEGGQEARAGDETLVPPTTNQPPLTPE
jgi:hypothetical protein